MGLVLSIGICNICKCKSVHDSFTMTLKLHARERPCFY